MALGTAQWIKHSSLWLYAILLVWVSIDLCRHRRSLIVRIIGSLAMVAGSLLVLNLGYLFEGSFTPLADFRFLSQSLTRPLDPGEINPDVASTNNLTYRDTYARRVNRFRGTWLGSLPAPVPFHYLAGFDEQKFEAEGKYPMYLRGKFADPIAPIQAGASPPSGNTRRGWWYYYLYALAVKVPTSTWLLVGLGWVMSIRSGRGRRVLAWMLLSAVPIASMSLLTDINLGLRYVLGSLPLFFLVAGSVAEPVFGPSGRWWERFLVILLLAWNGISVARVHPHELSYFAELAGGPRQGRHHLIDSNIDWGQDLRALSSWLNGQPDWSQGLGIAYAGTVPPEFEGIGSYQIPPRDLRFVPDRYLFPWEKRDQPQTWGPRPGKFAVSVNFERGMRFHTPLATSVLRSMGPALTGSLLGESRMAQMPRGCLAYFQEFQARMEPAVGYSILLFDISLDEANRVRHKMGLPAWQEPAGPQR
jgi:hypothetical protein